MNKINPKFWDLVDFIQEHITKGIILQVSTLNNQKLDHISSMNK